MRNSRFASFFDPTLIACVLMIGALMSAIPAKAQWQSTIGTVNIPFAFHAEDREMPAGMYRIVRESDSLLMLRGPNQEVGHVSVHRTMAAKAPAQGLAVFHRYGDRYFLGGFWTAGDSYGMECFKSRAEKEMLRTSKQQVPDLTTLAFNSTPQQ
jgi:hypothetical protein